VRARRDQLLRKLGPQGERRDAPQAGPPARLPVLHRPPTANGAQAWDNRQTMSKKDKPIPVTILTGFLGAGKTTLLNRILKAEHGLRVAVLVNDFGAVNIDAELIVGVEGETISLANGCICCTIRNDLLAAVLDLLQRQPPPEYILIETSGVSDPYAVAQSFLLPALSPYVRVDSIITVVDAEQDPRPARRGCHARSRPGERCRHHRVEQGGPGHRPEQLSKVKAWINDVAPRARILETTYGQVPLELLLGVGAFAIEKLHQRAQRDVHTHEVGEANDHGHDHDHHHDHSLVFNTWHYRTDEPLVYEALCDAVDALPTTIFRAKGVVYLKKSPQRRAILQVVGRRAMLTIGEPWQKPPQTQIVVIGSYGGVDGEKLQAIFDACRVSAVEAAKSDKLQIALDWVRRNWPKAFS
jgi:G3E family GTPase